MALSDEAQAAINEAVAIVAEDRLWSKINGRLAPPEPNPEPEPDDGKPKPPPAKPDEAAPDDAPVKAKPGAWWGELETEEEAS